MDGAPKPPGGCTLQLESAKISNGRFAPDSGQAPAVPINEGCRRGLSLYLGTGGSRTLKEGLQDKRSEVIEYWRASGSWLRSPILIAGDVTYSSLGNECLVGFTRLGNFLGLLDR
jgi:hypothetical protein